DITVTRARLLEYGAEVAVGLGGKRNDGLAPGSVLEGDVYAPARRGPHARVRAAVGHELDAGREAARPGPTPFRSRAAPISARHDVAPAWRAARSRPRATPARPASAGRRPRWPASRAPPRPCGPGSSAPGPESGRHVP